MSESKDCSKKYLWNKVGNGEYNKNNTFCAILLKEIENRSKNNKKNVFLNSTNSKEKQMENFFQLVQYCVGCQKIII